MAAISADDVSIDSSGNIRWTGAKETNRHTVLEFIQFLMDKQDDDQAAGDDLLDITVDTPFDRSTDQIVTLNAPFNIDDTFATHLYDGSVSQTNGTYGGEDLYSGLAVIGPVESGTEYMILQGGKVLPAFWGTGINEEASPSLVFSRHLVKSKEAGVKIDGQRITVLARELGDQFRRFPVTLGTGNSVAAISNGSDIFNEKSDTTLEGYTTITNTEGYQQIDIDGNGTGADTNEYYSQWTKAALEVNDVYERTKWISQRSHVTYTTAGTPTGSNQILDDAAGTNADGIAQQFTSNATTEVLTEARFEIKIGASDSTGLAGSVYAELYASDSGGPDAPTGGVLARSEPVLASAFTSSYEDTIFRFNRFNPDSGVDQLDNLTLTAATQYFIALRHDEGTATNYLHVEYGSSQDAAQDGATSTSAAWTGSSTIDFGMIVKSSPVIHGLPGEIFQGINVEVAYDAEGGAGVLETEATNDELVIWGTQVDYTAGSGSFIPGEPIRFEDTGVLQAGGILLYDDGTDDMFVALDTPGASAIAASDDIIGVVSGATGTVSAVANDEYSGGAGYVLAKDDNTGSGELYLQVIAGVNPVDNNVIYSTAGTIVTDNVTAAATITTRTLNPEFIGTSTGSNIIGTYGVGYNKDDIGSSDKFFDLSDTDRTPQNSVQFTVSGLTSGEDRVLVGPRNGTALDRSQWLKDGAETGGIATTPVTTLAIKTGGTDAVPVLAAKINHPNSGTGADVSRLRVEDTDGIYRRLPYDSFSTPTFTLGTPVSGAIDCEVTAGLVFQRQSGNFLTDGFEPGCVFTTTDFTNSGNNSQFVAETVTATEITVSDTTGMVTETGGGGDETFTGNGWEFNDGDSSTFAGLADGADVFMAYVDVIASAGTASFTGVHTTANDRDLFVRVRDGGGTPIKTFESDSAQFKSTPQTIAAVRTDDY